MGADGEELVFEGGQVLLGSVVDDRQACRVEDNNPPIILRLVWQWTK